MHERINFESVKRFGQSELDYLKRGAFGGDCDWGGKDEPAEKGPDIKEQSFLRRMQRFNPRQRMEDLLNTPSQARDMAEVGVVAVIILGYHLLTSKLSDAPVIPLYMFFWR